MLHPLALTSRSGDPIVPESMRNYSIRPRDDGRAAKRVLAMPLARRNGWFDDEVAIDFPSLHAAVERMRACFVAASTESDHSRRLSAELHLSPREAFYGVTVPLDVPVRKFCGACGGRGEIWSDPCVTVRWQRRGPRPPSCSPRRSSTRAGRRSICAVGVCSVRAAHACRSAGRVELNRGLPLVDFRSKIPDLRLRSGFQPQLPLSVIIT